MNIEQVREYTLSINGVTEDQPFGDDIITFRIEGRYSSAFGLVVVSMTTRVTPNQGLP